MEIHGVKIDLLGLAAVISAITSLVFAIKGEKNHGKKDKANPKK